MSVAKALLAYRDSAGVSQKAVAEMLGIAPQYLNDVEHDRRRLPDKWIKALPPGPLREALTKARQAEYADRTSELDGA